MRSCGAWLVPLVLLLLGTVREVAAEPSDEPATDKTTPEEPRFAVTTSAALVEGTGVTQRRALRVSLGFGWTSLAVDPDVGQGYGGGIFIAYEFYRRIGAEVSAYFSQVPYNDSLGSIGTSFLSGNISIGPNVRLTPANYWLTVHLDAGMGSYLVVPVIQEDSWTFGLHMGTTLTIQPLSWFGISIKPRYHLFNLANISGPALRDLKAFMALGVIDRFEIPICLTFSI